MANSIPRAEHPNPQFMRKQWLNLNGTWQFEKDMGDYSAGQKKKVLLARSLCEPSHLLVWDEPLNYVDVLSRIQLEELLLEFQPTIVFVEHDRVFCDRVATKAVTL